MIEGLIFGLLGFFLSAGIFAAGYYMGRKSVPPPPAAPAHTTTEEERVEQEKLRDKLREEQDAFHTLLSYNRDLAYGIHPDRKPGM